MNSVKLIAISKPVLVEIPSSEALLAFFARVSSSKQLEHDTGTRLLEYLQERQEWSPFEMCSMTVEIHTTRDISRQILRHRSFSFQEFSQRYAEVPDEMIVREARLQDKKNRQSSFEVDDEHFRTEFNNMQIQVWTHAMSMYKRALGMGIAKEQARALLPEGLTPTKMYMAGTIRSWIHYCGLRMGMGTQKEHRMIAAQCYRIMQKEFPSIS